LLEGLDFRHIHEVASTDNPNSSHCFMPIDSSIKICCIYFVSAWKESARAVGIDITKFGLQTHGNRPAAKALRSGSFADP
jgi:hypothetical protein